VTGIDKEIIRKLSDNISPMTTEDSEKMVGFIKKRLDELLTEFHTPPKQHVTETEGAFQLSS